MTSTNADQTGPKIQRYSLALPTRVEVKIDRKHSWNEMRRLEDISAVGAALDLKRPVKRGRLLLISLPMPRQLRCYDYLEPQYRVWAVVRRCIGIAASDDSRGYAVGIAFVGKNPPQGYVDNPAKLYDLATREDGGLWQLCEMPAIPDESDLPFDLRRHTRFAIPEPILIESLDENGDVAESEVTVTENLSLGGAAVFSSFNAEAGTFLRVKSERHGISIISIVRGRSAGQDGIARLHLEFIDNFFPLEGIA